MEKNIEGHFMYKQLHMTQQVPNIKDYFEVLLKNERFNTIIEIGTSLGGLTYIINDICDENHLEKKIHTFDNSYKDFVENHLNIMNIQYHILDETSNEFQETIKDLIINGGKTLILCDGGNKVSEFNTYSKHIKIGDFIMAHDYSIDQKEFEEKIKNKIWNWFEIEFAEIKDSIFNYNLLEYDKINFKDAAWACYYKQ